MIVTAVIIIQKLYRSQHKQLKSTFIKWHIKKNTQQTICEELFITTPDIDNFKHISPDISRYGIYAVMVVFLLEHYVFISLLGIACEKQDTKDPHKQGSLLLGLPTRKGSIQQGDSARA